MTTADDMTPHLRQTIEEAYELSVQYANLPDAPLKAYELSSLLNLISYIAKHPDATDYSADFGEYTIDLLNKIADRCTAESFVMHTPREHDIHNAVTLGHELIGIDKAIEQGRIAFGNKKLGAYPASYQATREQHHLVNRDFIETALFTELSRRREEIRQQLLQNFGPLDVTA